MFQAFFRGQGDAKWDIAPSLLHAQEKMGERKRVQNFIPSTEMTLFDTIAHIQHYQTETRFIDFSTNPDVAAYFACSSHQNADGAVFIYSYLPHEPQWYTSIVLSELTQLENDDAITVRSLSDLILKKYPYFRNRFTQVEDLDMGIVSFLDHGFMVFPNDENLIKNLRMQRQAGCFFICGVRFNAELASCDRWRSYAGSNRFLPHSAVVPDDLINGHGLVKVIVPKEIKSNILQDLAKRGISYEYLFPAENLL